MPSPRPYNGLPELAYPLHDRSIVVTACGRICLHRKRINLSLRHDCLELLGPSVTDAAKKLGVSRKQLADVINGHSGISPEMAIRLHKAFGGGADTWLRLQAAYDLAQVMKRAKETKVERITRAA